jgi:ABC-type polysaccharide/polyol phosphate transport system ATPase subunit
LNASLFGLTRRRTAELFDQIVDFSGVGAFIGQPLRTYSAGMIMRLAFSVAINVEPDILVVDEALAVGDQEFRTKCFERMLAFRESGRTMLVVSHAPDTLRHMCDRAIWLDRGKMAAAGSLDEVLEAYQSGGAGAS